MNTHSEEGSISLTGGERRDIESLAEKLVARLDRSRDNGWFDEMALASAELPRRLRERAYFFKRQENLPWLLVRNIPLREHALPRTPSEPGGADPINDALSQADGLHCLFGSLLGEPFGWSTHQDGRVLTDVLPTPKRQDELSGSGSAVDFDLHTEDAFHPCAPDYLGLMCLRNPSRTPTLVAPLGSTSLDGRAIRVLMQPRFVVGANPAQRVTQACKPTSILFGSADAPYMRVNLNRQHAIAEDHEAARALDRLSSELLRVRAEVVLQPGDILYIDNLRAAHGRPRFNATFDGGDRWFRRLFLATSLRTSRHLRRDPCSRVILPGEKTPTHW